MYLHVFTIVPSYFTELRISMPSKGALKTTTAMFHFHVDSLEARHHPHPRDQYVEGSKSVIAK